MEDIKQNQSINLDSPLDTNEKKYKINNSFPQYLSFNKSDRMETGDDHKQGKVLRILKEDQIPDIQFIAKSIAEDNFEALQSPPWIVIQMKNQDSEQFCNLVQDIYNQKKGKIYNLERILLWFPDFLQAKENTNQKLFFTEGSLNIEYRYYIAIIASAAFDCQYIYNRLVKDFLDMGGEESWIKGGMNNIPEKLKKITRLNTILAFQPQILLDQQLNLKYFEEIFSGDNLWTKSELITAFSIISYIHFLCGFVICFGINGEIDTYQPLKRRNSQDSILTNDDGDNEAKLQELEEQEKTFFDNMKKISSNLGENYSDLRFDYENGNNSKKEQIEEQKNQDKSLHDSSEVQKRKESKELKNMKEEQNKQFIKDKLKNDADYAQQILKKYPQYLHQEILAQQNQHKTVYLNGNEFNFKQNGVGLIAEHDEQLSKVLLEQLQIVKTMTNNVYGDKNLQTYPFRRAIRLYVENLNGFRYEGVDYKDHMNKLLHPDLKNFIRTVIIRPSHTTRKDYNDIPLYGLNITELAHIVLIALHAKMEMQLTYCTAALMKTQ